MAMPLVALAFGFFGTAVVVRWCVRQVQEADAEIAAERARAAVDAVDRNALPRLRQDPHTGEYRPD